MNTMQDNMKLMADRIIKKFNELQRLFRYANKL